MKIVLIKWIDSCTIDGWQTVTEEITPKVCLAAGFVVQENKEAISLSLFASDDDSGYVGLIGTIPKVCIISMKELKS